MDCQKPGLLYALGMGFGNKLKTARNAKDLSGEELGRQLGVSKATISHWENERYQPDLEQLKGLCNELEVSADWFLDREHIELPADALREAVLYSRLSPEDKRKWRTLRLTMFAKVES